VCDWCTWRAHASAPPTSAAPVDIVLRATYATHAHVSTVCKCCSCAGHGGPSASPAHVSTLTHPTLACLYRTRWSNSLPSQHRWYLHTALARTTQALRQRARPWRRRPGGGARPPSGPAGSTPQRDHTGRGRRPVGPAGVPGRPGEGKRKPVLHVVAGYLDYCHLAMHDIYCGSEILTWSVCGSATLGLHGSKVL